MDYYSQVVLCLMVLFKALCWCNAFSQGPFRPSFLWVPLLHPQTLILLSVGSVPRRNPSGSPNAA